MKLMQFFSAIACWALFCGHAFAQVQKLEIKGFTTGMKESEATTIFDKALIPSARGKSCKTPKDTTEADRLCELAIGVVNRIAFLKVYFYKDALEAARFDIATENTRDLQKFDEILAAMKEKYGKPTINGPDAIGWTRGTDTITIKKYQARSDDGVIIWLMSEAYPKETERRRKDIAVRNSKKL